MKVRLTRKLAEMINGVDLRKARAGEMLDLPEHDAEILLAEGWAEYAGGDQPRESAHEAVAKTRRRRKH